MSDYRDDISSTDDTDSTDRWEPDARILGNQDSQESSYTLDQDPADHEDHLDDDTYIDMNRPMAGLALDSHDCDDGHDVIHAVIRYDCVNAIGPNNGTRYGSKVKLLLHRYLNDLGANLSPGATSIGHSYP